MVHSLVATAVSSSLATVAFMKVVATIAAIMSLPMRRRSYWVGGDLELTDLRRPRTAETRPSERLPRLGPDRADSIRTLTYG